MRYVFKPPRMGARRRGLFGNRALPAGGLWEDARLRTAGSSAATHGAGAEVGNSSPLATDFVWPAGVKPRPSR
jgi:hypothetical protein